jgi:DNA-binding transcriptional ArsR family regulator
MASHFPVHTQVDHTPRERTDLVVDPQEQGDVLQTLTSETAQEILATLDDDPGTASDLADAVGTSLQNAQYHLSRLSDAGLVEPVDTWYSAKGREMTVYALTAKELVIQFGGDDRPVSPPSPELA